MKKYEVAKLTKSIEDKVRACELHVATCKGQTFAEYNDEPGLRDARMEQLIKEHTAKLCSELSDIINHLTIQLNK